MSLIDRLSLWNPWWNGENLSHLVGRPRLITDKIFRWADDSLIKVLVGPRRAGKSTIFYQLIDQLIKRGVEAKNILLINFQDEILNEHSINDIYLEYLAEMNPRGKVYLFLDEAQEKEAWQKWVKARYDMKKNISFFISGSNAKLLESEYSHYLSGRTIKFRIFPMNFREFLISKGVKLPLNEEEIARIRHYYKEYITFGGFPEVVFQSKEKKIDILTNYIQDFIQRDLVVRYKLKKDKVEKLVKWLFTYAGKPTSSANLERILKISGETLEKYIQYMKEIYLIIETRFFSPSLKKQILFPRKFYPIDLGLESVYSFSYREEGGKKLETAVAIELFTNGLPLFYYRNDFEVDFITLLNNQPIAVHVTHDKDLAREKDLPQKTARSLRIKKNIFVTLEGKDAFWYFALKTLPTTLGNL